MPYCSTILICVIFHSLFFFDLNFLFRWETLIDFCSPLKKFFFFFFFFEIWNFLWKMIPFVLDHPWKFIFPSFKIEIFLKLMPSIFEKFFFFNFFYFISLFFFFKLFFFWVSWLRQLNQTWVDLATQVY